MDDLTFYSMLSVLQGGMWLLNDIESYLIPFQISHGRFSILLSILEAEGEALNPSELAIVLGKSKPTISKMINKLLADEFIIKMESKDDKRATTLQLTMKGKAILDRIIPGYNERIKKMSSNLTVSEQKELMQIISKIDFLNPKRLIKVIE